MVLLEKKAGYLAWTHRGWPRPDGEPTQDLLQAAKLSRTEALELARGTWPAGCQGRRRRRL